MFLDMAESKKKRLNLYLPDDHEELMRALKHAVVDAGTTVNAFIFDTLRERLGLKSKKLAKDKR